MSVDDPILARLLSEACESLDRMEHRGGLGDLEAGHLASGEAGPFLSRLFHIGLRLHRSPDLVLEPPVQQLLARGAGPKSRVGIGIQIYARELEQMIRESWHIASDGGIFAVDRWARACTERSALEFFLELMPGILFDSEREELDEILAQCVEQFQRKIDSGEATPHPEQIPAGVPLSHPWWRA